MVTLLLLEAYRAHKNDVNSSTKRKNDIWKKIAQQMEETGYTVKYVKYEKWKCDQETKPHQKW